MSWNFWLPPMILATFLSFFTPGHGEAPAPSAPAPLAPGPTAPWSEVIAPEGGVTDPCWDPQAWTEACPNDHPCCVEGLACCKPRGV